MFIEGTKIPFGTKSNIFIHLIVQKFELIIIQSTLAISNFKGLLKLLSTYRAQQIL